MEWSRGPLSAILSLLIMIFLGSGCTEGTLNVPDDDTDADDDAGDDDAGDDDAGDDDAGDDDAGDDDIFFDHVVGNW